MAMKQPMSKRLQRVSDVTQSAKRIRTEPEKHNASVLTLGDIELSSQSPILAPPAVSHSSDSHCYTGHPFSHQHRSSASWVDRE